MRLRRIPVAIALAALAMLASAATYGSTVASQPLTGRVPGVAVRHQRGSFSAAGYNYRIVVEPSLQGGTAGWASALSYSLHGRSGGGSGGGGGYPTKRWPFCGGGGFSVYARAPSGDIVDYVLTAPEVAAVRVGKLTILTFSDSRLPAGDRAAVFFRPAAAPPAFAIPGIYRPRHAVRVVPLDAAGHVIPTGPPLYQSATAARYWQAPTAVTPTIHEPPFHGATHPLPGACELAQHGLPGLVPEWGHVIGRIRAVRGSEGAVFLSCIDTEYYLHGWPLDVGVLLDGAQPGKVLGPIPGAQPVAGHPGVVNLAAGQFPGSVTAKQVGEAWLVVQGGANLRQRLHVLQALRIARLALPRQQQAADPRAVNAQIVANFAQFRRPRTAADALPASIPGDLSCSGPFSEGGPKGAALQGLEAFYQVQCFHTGRAPAGNRGIKGLQRDQSRAVRLPGRLGTIWLIPWGGWLCNLFRSRIVLGPGEAAMACEPVSEVLAYPPLWNGGMWGVPGAPSDGNYLFALEPDRVTKVTVGYPGGTKRAYLAHNVLGACIRNEWWLNQTGPTISGVIKMPLSGGSPGERYRPKRCPHLP